MIFNNKKILNKKLLLAELALIISSVLIFRSLWLLLDRLNLAKSPLSLILLLALGFLIYIPAVKFLIKRHK